MKSLNNHQKIIIGMIHLPSTLSFPDWSGLDKFVTKAITDLHALEAGGINAALIENDADHPCQVKGGSDVIAPMAIVAHELSKISSIPLGIEVLLNDPQASLDIAKVCNLSFIRTDYFVDKMTRENYGEFDINSQELMKYRHKIHADDIKIYTDVQVKYATMVNPSKSLNTSISQALAAGSDGVIITGSKTGEKPVINDLITAQKIAAGKVPVIIGSGFSEANSTTLFKYADVAIVGTSIKTGDYVDVQKVKQLVKSISVVK